MPLFPEINVARRQTISAKGNIAHPKSSALIIEQANGVLVDPENTPTNPNPANNIKGKGMYIDRKLVSVAPIKNKGVTSPPLNPMLKVNEVKIIFNKKS